MSELPHTLCERCRQPLDANDPEAVKAYELVTIHAMGSPVERLDGLQVVFHATCFPVHNPNYRRVKHGST